MSKQSDIKYLVSKGLPEVYAYMAVEAPDWKLCRNNFLSGVLIGSFSWGDTKEGYDFWKAIYNNALFIETGGTQ